MKNIDDAIKHCEEVAEKQEITAKSNLIEIDKINADGILRLYDAGKYESCMKCAEEHRQLAEWLKELKKYRAIFEKVGKILADNGYTMDDLDTIFGKANDECKGCYYNDGEVHAECVICAKAERGNKE